jgi:hypothetical protein
MNKERSDNSIAAAVVTTSLEVGVIIFYYLDFFTHRMHKLLPMQQLQ